MGTDSLPKMRATCVLSFAVLAAVAMSYPQDRLRKLKQLLKREQKQSDMDKCTSREMANGEDFKMECNNCFCMSFEDPKGKLEWIPMCHMMGCPIAFQDDEELE